MSSGILTCEKLNAINNLKIPVKSYGDNLVINDNSYNIYYDTTKEKLWTINKQLFDNYIGSTINDNYSVGIKLTNNSGIFLNIENQNNFLHNLNSSNIILTENKFLVQEDISYNKKIICQNLSTKDDIICSNEIYINNINISFNDSSNNVFLNTSVFENDTSVNNVNNLDKINVENTLTIQQEKEFNTQSILPVGSIISWAGELNASNNNITKIGDLWIINNKFLYCNGSSCNKSDYPVLFNMVGNSYGGTDPNFNLPDLRGRTLFGDNTDTTNSKIKDSGIDTLYNYANKYIGDKNIEMSSHTIDHGHTIENYGNFELENIDLLHNHPDENNHNHAGNLTFKLNYNEIVDDDYYDLSDDENNENKVERNDLTVNNFELSDISLVNFDSDIGTINSNDQNDIKNPILKVDNPNENLQTTYHTIENVVEDINNNQTNVIHDSNDFPIDLPSILIHFLIKAKN